jgi:hypothetical protein
LLPASLQQRPDYSQNGAVVEQRMEIREDEEEFWSVHVGKATLVKQSTLKLTCQF